MTKLKADVFNERCKSRDVLDLLAEKWALLLLHSLAIGPKRTAELHRHVGGISEKMLIQTLRRLQRQGFVRRKAYAEVPPRVEYHLTDLGASLAKVVRALDDWVEINMAVIMKSQKEFDTAAN